MRRSLITILKPNVRQYTPTSIDPKQRIVIIGTGWAGATVTKNLDPKTNNLTVLSNRDHMLFTPLLPQTVAGTLNVKSICEPIQRLQPALATKDHNFHRIDVADVDFDKKIIKCVSTGSIYNSPEVRSSYLEIPYDKLIFAHGASPNFFNTPGVEKFAFFLREISDSSGLRNRMIENLELAMLPTTTNEERSKLLSVVIVGGGPTGVEFACDLAHFIDQDLKKHFYGLASKFTITIVEPMDILGPFSPKMKEYAHSRLQNLNIKVIKGIVSEVCQNEVKLKDGKILSSGMTAWSTGVGPSPLTRRLTCDKAAQGRIAINSGLQVLRNGEIVSGVFAIGDCAADINTPLPTLAAVASRQGKFLSQKINKDSQGKGHISILSDPFNFTYIGGMVSLGKGTALGDFRKPNIHITGFKAFVLWRSFYLSLASLNRTVISITFDWLMTYLFGRDIPLFQTKASVDKMKEVTTQLEQKVTEKSNKIDK